MTKLHIFQAAVPVVYTVCTRLTITYPCCLCSLFLRPRVQAELLIFWLACEAKVSLWLCTDQKWKKNSFPKPKFFLTQHAKQECVRFFQMMSVRPSVRLSVRPSMQNFNVGLFSETNTLLIDLPWRLRSQELMERPNNDHFYSKKLTSDFSRRLWKLGLCNLVWWKCVGRTL